MKLTQGKCRITGVQLGEATVSYVQAGPSPLRAKFVLLKDEMDVAGEVVKTSDWSEKTMELIKALSDSMEEDAMASLFDMPEIQPPEDSEIPNEPQQF